MTHKLVPDDHVIVLFGATGDLARRKLLPGLFRLAAAGVLPERYRIVATSRTQLDDAGFVEFAREANLEFGRHPELNGTWSSFAQNLSYVETEPSALASAVERAERELGGSPRRLHYLSVPPFAFGSVVETLRPTGLAEGARVVLEKPFGTDLESARELNSTVHSVFDESDVFRIDHFLGKETVQNILARGIAGNAIPKQTSGMCAANDSACI